MADITNQVTVKGGGTSQDTSQPFENHVWEITVPAALLTATTNDIILGDFPDGTRLFPGYLQVWQAATLGTSCTIDIERSLIAADGTESTVANLVSGIDGNLVQNAAIASSTSLPLFTTGNGSKGRINVEITGVGATSGTDLIMYLTFVMGRAEE